MPLRAGPVYSCAILLCLFAACGNCQEAALCTVPAGVDQTPTGANFFASFASAPGAPATPYEISMPAGSGATAAGDLNATYFSLYYSITNLNAWMRANGYCPVELVIAGTFPDARYFSITDNDMHYTATQHLADADIDPVSISTGNPFVPGPGGVSPPYSGTQQYLVPVSLGYIPKPANVIAGCGINSSLGDNVLDATQRHASIDWNTNVQGPSVATGLSPHVVDTPGHSNPNTAGSIIVRSYLGPPESCTGTPGVNLQCTQANPPQSPYLIVRDVQTGCAYTAAYLESNQLVNGVAGSCAGSNPPACNAIVSLADLSASSTKWLDQGQKQQHTNNASITPQACYANGDPTVPFPLPFANRVAWTRVAQWEGSPGPDDSYIGGSISTSDLTALTGGSVCAQKHSGDGCVMRLRFQLPLTPDTPCNAPYTCGLTNSAQLRYSSLTFWYQTAPPAGTGNKNGNSPVSVASLADPAFTTNNGYVTLIVNTGAMLPSWMRQANGAGIIAGAQPVRNSKDYYTAWTVNGYTVIDLSVLSTFSTSYPLLLTMRNTLPAATFGCSGAAVPFSTAEYTNADGNGGGLMGPYVPLVDYIDPNTLPTTAPVLTPSDLPSAAACGMLPSANPSYNAPALPGNLIDWPVQAWPSAGNSLPPYLTCSSTSSTAPEVYFAATQFSTPALTYNPSCGSPDIRPNPCDQIIAQSPQNTEYSTAWQPALPVTLAGSGFGWLPQTDLPGAAQNFSYLQISDAEAAGGNWSTGTSTQCQIYIANWTDTSISILANLPFGLNDGYGVQLSPLSDFGPLTTGAAAGCPVAAGDHLTFSVTNPQTGVASLPLNVVVSPAGTAPF